LSRWISFFRFRCLFCSPRPPPLRFPYSSYPQSPSLFPVENRTTKVVLDPPIPRFYSPPLVPSSTPSEKHENGGFRAPRSFQLNPFPPALPSIIPCPNTHFYSAQTALSSRSHFFGFPPFLSCIFSFVPSCLAWGPPTSLSAPPLSPGLIHFVIFCRAITLVPSPGLAVYLASVFGFS